jgi:hypothetical protein
VVALHVSRLHEDGLLCGEARQLLGTPIASVHVRDLTSAGHRFLAALETGDIWARIKDTLYLSELGALAG